MNECKCKHGQAGVNCHIHKIENESNYWFEKSRKEKKVDKENQDEKE